MGGWWFRLVGNFLLKWFSAREIGTPQQQISQDIPNRIPKKWMMDKQPTHCHCHCHWSSKESGGGPSKFSSMNAPKLLEFFSLSEFETPPGKVWFFRWRLQSKRINWLSCVSIHPGRRIAQLGNRNKKAPRLCRCLYIYIHLYLHYTHISIYIYIIYVYTRMYIYIYCMDGSFWSGYGWPFLFLGWKNTTFQVSEFWMNPSGVHFFIFLWFGRNGTVFVLVLQCVVFYFLAPSIKFTYMYLTYVYLQTSQKRD